MWIGIDHLMVIELRSTGEHFIVKPNILDDPALMNYRIGSSSDILLQPILKRLRDDFVLQLIQNLHKSCR